MTALSSQLILRSSLVRQNAGQLSAEIDGEIVLLGLMQGKYYGLDAIGSVLWRRMAEPRRVADLCADLVLEYDADAARIEADLIHFLAALAEQGLIEVL